MTLYHVLAVEKWLKDVVPKVLLSPKSYQSSVMTTKPQTTQQLQGYRP